MHGVNPQNEKEKVKGDRKAGSADIGRPRSLTICAAIDDNRDNRMEAMVVGTRQANHGRVLNSL